MNCMSKRGTVAIETAIGMTAVLIFIGAILSVLTVYRTDLIMQAATDQSCEKLSLYMPLSVTASDAISTLTNAMPDDAPDMSDSLQEALTVLAGIDAASDRTLTSEIFTLAFAGTFEDDIAASYVERNGGSGFMLPEDIDVAFDLSSDISAIRVDVSYSVMTLAGPVTRNITSFVPFYGDFDLFLSGASTEAPDTDVWGKNNLERGTWFEEYYGADLPHTFPVINSFEDGMATSFVSMDVTAPTYSDPSNITEKILEEASELAAFDGADVTISGQEYNIPGESITGRTLLVVIPENASPESVAAIEYAGAQALLQGVSVRVEQYGVSNRYS